MADAKLTDLQSATSLNPADVMYVVQSATDKKVSIATLLGSLPNTPTRLRGVLALGGTPQNLVNSGNITTTENTTFLSNTENSVLTIADGTYESQIKVVIMTTSVAESILQSNIGVGSIRFSAAGHSVLLLWYSGNWWPIGGTATITV